MKTFIVAILLGSVILHSHVSAQEITSKPNIVIIYADDLGYGDIGINGAKGVKTPNIDRLAKKGVNFSDVHCSSSTCTPSRYSLLTGSYAFRNNAAILTGDAPLIIDTNKGTLPSMLKKAGYTTGVVGKWHLGLGNGKVDWNKEIKPGPREIGFDYSFLIPATGDRVPCVFVENQKVLGLDKHDPIKVSYGDRIDGYPIGSEHPEMLKVKTDPQHLNSIINGISRIGYMSGGKDALWVDEDFPFVLTNKGESFIEENKDNPFFLYFAFNDIHQPRIPNKKFVGASTMGPRGDAIAQLDWCTGELIKKIEDLGLAENTLIIFTSDNGPILDDGYVDQAIELVGKHKPAGPYRGSKYSIYEAGTRMPAIVYWPGTVSPGKSSAMLTQVDLYASLADLVGQKIDKGDAPDSKNYLNAWFGRTKKGREVMLEEAYTLGLRMGNWKYILPQSQPTPDWLQNKDIETGLMGKAQLYNLKKDKAEQKNVLHENPKIAAKMEKKMNEILQQ